MDLTLIAVSDKETSRSSTSPYSSDDAHHILQALKEIDHYCTSCHSDNFYMYGQTLKVSL